MAWMRLSDGAIVTCPSCGTRWQCTTTAVTAVGDTEETR